jgi:DNA repair ATPase RecN
VRYIPQVNHIANAAADVARGVYNPYALDGVAQRMDELGQLVRVFQDMVREVDLREEKLRQEVHQLRIRIDESKRQQQVEQLTETDFFQELQPKAGELRRSRNDSS